MDKNKKLIHQLYWILFCCFSGIVLLADYLTPLGIATGILYVLPIISSTFLFSSKKDLYAALVVITGLVFLGYSFSHHEVTELWIGLLNRGLTLFIVWASGLICYLTIVERTKSEAHQKKFEKALEAAPNGMVMIDERGQITLVNKQIETLFGYKREELLGQKIEILVPKRFRKDHPGHRVGFFQAPTDRSMGAGRDLFGLIKDGKEIPVEIGLNPIITDEGTFVLASIIDITERKNAVEREKYIAVSAVSAEENRKRVVELDRVNKNLQKSQVASLNIMKDLARRRTEIEAREQQLKETQQMLVQAGKLAAMGQLGAGISHELNQPLAAIRGYAQVVDSEIKDDDPHKADLQKIIEMTTRMSVIIDNVRAFSRDTKEDKNEPVDINKAIDDGLMLVNEQFRQRSIELICDFTKELPHVAGNANQLQQVFINLATNARDALEGVVEGKIWVMTRAASMTRRDTQERSHDESGVTQNVEILFKNNGPPIPKDKINQIFNPFFTTKEVGKGTGLGLSISYGIIKDHGGEITVSSTREGVTFRILLPVA